MSLIQRLHHQQNLSKVILAIVLLLLFLGNSRICYFFYDMSKYTYGSVEYALLNDKWWDLRLNITSVVFMLGFVLARIGSDGVLRFILSVGIGLSLSNVIDRVFFDVQVYTKSDIFMLITTLSFSIYEYVKRRRKIIK